MNQISSLRAAALGLAVLFIMSGCGNQTTEPLNDGGGTVVLEFDNVVGPQELVLSGPSYVNATGESFTVTTCRYFISNVVLHRQDGAQYTIPQDSSYFLVDEAVAASRLATLSKIPAGTYTSISFMIGVDSLRSASDVSRRTGVLDPGAAAADMYWVWNSGYIFMKLEGSSPAAPEAPSGERMFRYHVGGFGGIAPTPTINNIRTVRLSIPGAGMKVQRDKKTTMHLLADIMRIFDATPNVSIAANPTVMLAPFSSTIADNYATMFSVDHVH